jgi:hypothetical protein
MSNLEIAFYVVGTLFVVYLVAATWRSRDQDPHARDRAKGRLTGR